MNLEAPPPGGAAASLETRQTVSRRLTAMCCARGASLRSRLSFVLSCIHPAAVPKHQHGILETKTIRDRRSLSLDGRRLARFANLGARTARVHHGPTRVFACSQKTQSAFGRADPHALDRDHHPGWTAIFLSAAFGRPGTGGALLPGLTD